MLTEQEKRVMWVEFDNMSAHDQVAIHALIHMRSTANNAVKKRVKNKSRLERPLRNKLGGAKD